MLKTILAVAILAQYAPGEAPPHAARLTYGPYVAIYGEDWRPVGGRCILMEITRGDDVVFVLYADKSELDNTHSLTEYDVVTWFAWRIPEKACGVMKEPVQDAPRAR